MVSDDRARQLHDEASRGGSLSSDERAQLDEWLSAQDQAETRLLSPKSVSCALAELRTQVDSALDRVGVITRSIQQLSAENDSLRREIAALRNRLAARPVSQPT